ncbi:MAG: ABC transporter family substrate-binding protein [Propionibacteriaceae bacterium]|jgi:peptide/nickel transport system substrate-binding protein|nr:ABC transporter family substrate-binding protein [Propionibacteriaceae bacterium]
MIKKPQAMAAGFITLALALSACSGGGQPTNGADASTGASSTPAGTESVNINAHPYSDLKDGGELNLSASEFTEQKNQFQADGSVDTWTFWDMYNPEVIKFTPEGEVNINKNYLDDVKIEQKDGNTVVTYKINEKATYNDGTPIDVKAYQNTWKANNGSDKKYFPNSVDGYNMIKSVEAGASDKEAIVTFNGIWLYPHMLFNTLLHPAVNTADLFNKAYVGDDIKSAHPEWGAGPYKIDTFDGKAGIATFVKNEKWWGDPGKLDKITFTLREGQAGMNAFKNGESDVAGVNDNNQLTDAASVPNTDLRMGATAAIGLLQMNDAQEAMKDINLRKAIMTAIDRKQLVEVKYQGMNYTETPPGSLVLYPYQKGYVDNFSAAIPESGPDAAKKILTDAGYTLGDDGYFAKDGKKVHVKYTLVGDVASVKAFAQVIQQQLKVAGIEMEIVQRSSADFTNIMKDSDFEMMTSRIASSDPYGTAWTCQIWCSKADDSYSGLFKVGQGTPELDKLIHEKVEAATDLDTQIAEMNKIEAEEFKTYHIMPIYMGPTAYQVKSGLANMGAGIFACKSSSFCDFRENLGYTN